MMGLKHAHLEDIPHLLSVCWFPLILTYKEYGPGVRTSPYTLLFERRDFQ